MVAKEPSGLDDARTIAYAIYLLSREGVVTTNYMLNLRDYLDKNFEKEWPADLTGVYLAGAQHILKKEDEATKLIARYRIGHHDPAQTTDFYQPLGADAQYVAILAREFPARLKKISAAEFGNILKPVSDGTFNTLSAAYAVLALKSYSQMVAQHPPELTIEEIDKAKHAKRLTSGNKLLQRTDFSGDAGAIRFRSAAPLNPPGAFLQVIEAGFDRQLPNKALNDGLEIYRELLDKSGKPVTTRNWEKQSRSGCASAASERNRCRMWRWSISCPVVLKSSERPCRRVSRRSREWITLRSARIARSSTPQFQRRRSRSLTRSSRATGEISSSRQSSPSRCMTAT